MATEPDHIRCCTTCHADAGQPLVVAKCGRCLFHASCLPTNCKCGRPAHPHRSVGKRGCYAKHCGKAPEGWRLLCPDHAREVIDKAVKRLKLVGSLHHAALVSYLQYFPGMQLEGDILQMVTEQVTRALRDDWRIFCTSDGRYVHFLAFIAELSGQTPFSPEAMAQNLELPPQAATELLRVGRSRLNGWELQADGQVKHSSRKGVHTPTNADELCEFLSSPSRPTFPTAKAAAFYPDAPGDINALIEAGKLVYIEHYKFVSAPPKHHTPNPQLRDYWMEHVAAELRAGLGSPGL